MTKTENRITAFACKRGLPHKWQKLRFDSQRMCIETANHADFSAVYEAAKRIKNATVETWRASSMYAFEGVVYIYDTDVYNAFEAAQKKELDRNFNWCMMYHNLLTYGATPTQASKQAELYYPTPKN